MKTYRTRKAERMIKSTYDELLLQWGVPVTELDLSSPYGTTHVLVAGDEAAEPLVMFHGVGDDSALMWLYNAKALTQRYRLYAVDTIGGPGKSVPGAGYCKGFSDVDWIDSILDGLGLSHTSMVGTSHGAYLTQYYTAHRPQRIKHAVCLAGTVPVEGSNPMAAMMRIFLPEALFPTEQNTAKLLRKLSGSNSAVFLENPAVMAHYRWLLKGFQNAAMRYHPLPPLDDEHIDILREKTLYLVGAKDPFQRFGAGEPLSKHRMNYTVFDDVGHGINHEIADTINGILLSLA